MGKENRRKFIDAYPTVSRSAGLCFESAATRGSWRVVVASVAACKQSDQDKRLKHKRKTRLTKRQDGEKKEEMSSTLLLSILLSSKQPDLPFQSSSCRAECQPSAQCNSPIRGSCPGWGEVCTFMHLTSPQKWLGRGANLHATNFSPKRFSSQMRRCAASQEEPLLPTGAPTSLRKATLASQRTLAGLH